MRPCPILSRRQATTAPNTLLQSATFVAQYVRHAVAAKTATPLVAAKVGPGRASADLSQISNTRLSKGGRVVQIQRQNLRGTSQFLTLAVSVHSTRSMSCRVDCICSGKAYFQYAFEVGILYVFVIYPVSVPSSSRTVHCIACVAQYVRHAAAAETANPLVAVRAGPGKASAEVLATKDLSTRG